jgi:Predicted metal-dependent hydrolase of the TIM-barrel fold
MKLELKNSYPYDINSTGLEIIDCHGHVGTYLHQIPYQGNIDSVLKMMDIAGIKMSTISHTRALVGDIAEGNRIVWECVKKHPDRLIGLMVYNPNYSIEYNKERIEKYLDTPNIRGLKIHTTLSNTSAGDPRFEPFFSMADERDLFVLCHTWRMSDVKGIEKYAKAFPNVKIIMGHSGGPDFDVMYEAIEVVRRNDNVYLDLTISINYEGMVELFVNEVSASRVLFGSDNPFMDARFQLGKVLYARVSDSDKEKILSLNMKNILGIHTHN